MARKAGKDRGVYEDICFTPSAVLAEGGRCYRHPWTNAEEKGGLGRRTCEACGRVEAGRFLHTGVFWIRWTCNYGHEHQERIGPKGAAKEAVEKRRVAVKTEDYCLTRAREAERHAKPALFRDVRARYVAWSQAHRPRSITFREKALKHLGAAFDGRALTEIVAADVEAYIARRRDAGAAPATVNRERAVLSHLFTKAQSWGLAKANPVAGTERQDEANEAPRPLTPDEEARLLAALPRSKRAWPHWRALVTLAVHTGLRLGELLHQAWRDVDLPSGVLTVTRPKSGKPETIPLNATARAVLAGLERMGPLVFPALPKKASDVFSGFVTRAKLEGVTFHCLRDSFISRLAAVPDMSTPALMALARHRDYRTTRRYVRVDGAHLRQAVEKLAPGATVTQTVTGDSPLVEVIEILEGKANV